MIKSFVKNHRWGIVLSIVIGFIMVGPQLYFIYSLGDSYNGLYMMKSDAETNYLTRMQEFKDGNGVGNPFIYEYKNSFPMTFFTISEGILVLPAIILNISTANINLFYKFLLPFLTCFLAYYLSFRLLGNKVWSLVIAIVIMLGDSLFSTPSVLTLLKKEMVFSQFATYARPFSPGFSSVLFFSYLHILLTAIKKKEWRWFICIGLISALSYYVYFFLFTFVLALNVVFIALFYLLKSWDISKKLSWATLGGFIIGFPVLLNALKVNQNPYYKNIALFVDIHGSRTPVFATAGVVIMALFVWYLCFRGAKRSLKDYFLLGLIITSFVAINQQVVTGIWLHEGHYHLYFNKPIFTMVLFWTIWGFFNLSNLGVKIKKLAPIFLVFVSLISFYSVIFIQYSSYNAWRDDFAKKQDYVPIFDWLKENTPAESVVLANTDVSEYVPIFTSNNVYMEAHAVYYLMPPERMIDSLFLYLKLNKYGPDKIKSEQFFHPEGSKLRAQALKNVRDLYLLSDDLIMAYPPNSLEIYKKYWTDSFAENLRQYRLDYIIWNKLEDPMWGLEKYSNLRVVYSFKDLSVYQVKAP